MSDRLVRYQVQMDAAQAQAQARQLAQIFAKEMSAAQSTAARSGAGVASAGGGAAGGMSPLMGMAFGALGGLAGHFTARAITSFTMDVAALNTQLTNSRKGFETLSGGAAEAERRLQAIQRASGGTMTELTAMNLANRLVALGMANSAAEMESAVETGRKIATVMGGDVQGALENLSLAAANLSFMRLDQMGISATKVRERMAELQDASANLGKEQAFLQAAMEVANNTFAKIDTSAAVNGVAALTSALTDLGNAAAESKAGDAINATLRGIADNIRLAQGDPSTLERVTRSALTESAAEAQGMLDRNPDQWGAEGLRESIDVYERALALLDQYQAAVAAGVPVTERMRQEVMDIATAMNSGGTAFNKQDDWVARLSEMEAALGAVSSETSAYQVSLSYLGQEYVTQSAAAQGVLTQIAALDMQYASGQITAQEYAAALSGIQVVLGQLKGEAEAAAEAIAGVIPAEMRRDILAAQGYVLNAQGQQVRDPKTGAFVVQPWAPDYEEGVNDGSYLLEYQYKQAQEKARADEQAAREWASAARQTQSDFEAAAEAMVNEWESRLDQIPGLMGTSSVTEGDMAATKAGVYEEKPDEWLRQLAAEVASGRDEFPNADIRDAARRAGLSPDLDPQAIYAQVAAQWEDSSFFAGGKNLDLVNQAAVRAALARQEASASGREALLGLFPVAGSVAGSRDTNVDPALLAAQQADADPAQMMAGLAQGFSSEETASALRDIGVGMAGHLYSGFAGGIAEQDWASPILDNLMGRLVAQTAAAMTTAMQP